MSNDKEDFIFLCGYTLNESTCQKPKFFGAKVINRVNNGECFVNL